MPGFVGRPPKGRSTSLHLVALDRSDAKITVSGIKLSVCIVHAEWRKLEEGQQSKRQNRSASRTPAKPP
ncbi:MAG: hypothetical protein TH68_03775 [Candidatus Synechococcus spongiarum 142]|uniref:Uncharacterized protein n=1 Tax=Candidatus Synechococcus spongiarum 142 TaxID=1608213 RepID=A0A6N3X952_9SYNE|nr:MAG: hypothetical protein TH68_03775 [Candidatus Synechococcus spongiarum 142]